MFHIEPNVHPRQIRAASYSRVSSVQQEDDGSSLDTQATEAMHFAQQRGYHLIPEYAFQDTHTGADLFGRQGLAQLRDVIRDRLIDVVICYTVDCLARETAHLHFLLVEAKAAGVRIEFVKDNFEDTPEGRLFLAVNGYVAEVERLKIAERTVRGRLARVKSGKLMPGGKPLYGYQWEDAETKERLVLNPIEAPIARRCFEQLAAGNSLGSIVTDLNRDCVPTPTGKGTIWYASTVAKMLHKPAYKGEAYGWGHCKRNGLHPQHFDIEKAIKLPDGTIPPLVDSKTWDAVQSILARNKVRSIRSAKDPESALLRGGYIKCGYCGHTMRVRPKSDGGAEYVRGLNSHVRGGCDRHAVSTRRLDAAVWEKLERILLDPKVIADEVARLRQTDPTEADLSSIDNTLGDIERQRSNLTRALSLLDDVESQAVLIAQLQKLTERQRVLESDHYRVLQRQQSWQISQASLDELEEWSKNVVANLRDLSFSQKRLALDALGFSIEVYRNDHDPRWVITCGLDTRVVNTIS